MINKKHYTHQIKYFDKEFSGMQTYKLAAWQKSYITRIKKYMLDKEFKKKTLLDVASGSGYIAIEMAKMGMNVIATDLSPQSLKNLNNFKKQFKLRNLTLIECKAEKIPLKSKSVDYLVANAILEHIPAESSTIREWKRLVKPGGKMFITVPLQFRYIWPFLWIINYIHDKRIGHLRRYDVSILRKRFKLKVLNFFYTGHLVKIVGILKKIIYKTDKFDNYYEKMDDKKSQKRYGANNVSVIFIQE